MKAQLNLFGQDDVVTGKPRHFESVNTKSRERYEYFILVSPDENIKRMIALKKSTMNYEIGISESNLWSIAHVSLFKFTSAIHEQLIVPKMKKVLESINKFRLDIKNLDVYDHGSKKSIVFKFQNDEALKQINSVLQLALLERYVDIDPHLTIARSVPNHDYDRIANLNTYFFNGSFECNKITVLRRPWNKKTRYEVFAEVSLGGSQDSWESSFIGANGENVANAAQELEELRSAG